MKLFLLGLCIPMLLVSCTGPRVNSDGTPDTRSDVQRAVEDEGYTYVSSNGPIFFSCSKDDSSFSSEEIVAKNANGKEVVLKVCCGGPLSFKGCTIRH